MLRKDVKILCFLQRNVMEERTDNQEEEIHILPVLPLPGRVIFPRIRTILVPAREKSLNAVRKALESQSDIFLLNQKEPEKSVDLDNLYDVGTIARIYETVEENGTLKMAVETYARGSVIECYEEEDDDDGYIKAQVKLIADRYENSENIETLVSKVISKFEEYVKNSKRIPKEALNRISKEEEPGFIADMIAFHIQMKAERQQILLEAIDVEERLEILIEMIKDEMELSEIDKEIDKKLRKRIEKTNRNFYLTEKMKLLQDELGKSGGKDFTEIEDLRKKIKDVKMSEEAEKKALKEVDRLEQLPPMSPETGVIRTYLDWLIALPWSKETESKIDIKEAERILEEGHYGLKDAKERILEYLAVLKLVKKLKGPILCFVGPPGTGKTSFGKSIAEATGRNFVRMSLGSVRDEAEIRGHRRTYIGALPGRIIEGLRDAESKNPLFLLDEIDKMCADFRGDPAAALLEVLDPEQNDTFRDHYLDVEFDLSEVMFITTANILSAIPQTLRDRLEVIEFPGYTEYEKFNIAKGFLLPKQLEAHGLKEDSIALSDEAIYEIIRKYTREAGVREIERKITNVCRKVARKIAEDEDDKTKTIKVDESCLIDYLGLPKYTHGKAEENDQVGVATGLSYTQVGGDIISIEAVTMDGEGELTMTGSLGEVMKESAQTALGYIRSQADNFNLPNDFSFGKRDIHLHVPEGAQPKEGPSAGITIATAIISALTGKYVRKDFAMTGEITLRGKVLQIGGLKEKILAAHRANIKNIIIPSDNEKDLSEIPDEIKKDLSFYKVENMDKVLNIVLRDN